MEMEFRQFRNTVDRRAPAGQYQYVEVTFELADVDTAVKHQLRASPYTDIMYQVVKRSVPCQVYEDVTGTRLPWTADVIYLRCDTAGAQVRLLLTTKG